MGPIDTVMFMNTAHTASWHRVSSAFCAVLLLSTLGCVAELGTEDGFASAVDESAGGDEKAIVGGADVSIAQNPWQVSLQADGSHFCGGSIISDRWVVTAQHCVEGETASRLRIVAGATRLSRPADGQTRQVAEIIVVPGYTSAERGKDMALLRLATPLTLGATVAAIGLATDADNATQTGVMASVTGWGTLRAGGSIPDALKGVAVPVVTMAAAQRVYSETLTADQLAAGGTGTDSCQGDSGGPLTVNSPRGRLLVGVVSWGYGCGDPGVPGMYARMTSYASWVSQQTGIAIGGGSTAPTPTTPTPTPTTPTAQTLIDQVVAGAASSFQHAAITVPAGTSVIEVSIDGSVGDADLYVRQGSRSTTTRFDCRPYTGTSQERCFIQAPAAGTWYVSVRGYSAFSGARLVATVR
jgi:secreted trypsin-like serine protease